MDVKQLEELGLDASDPNFEEQAMALMHESKRTNYEEMVRDSEEPTPDVEQTRSMSGMQF